MACSLAFDRFVETYRKYSDDQPRDEHGRWVDAGGGSEPDTTGALTPIYVERTGDPLIDGITDRLSGITSDVEDLLGPGEGARYGTQFHYEFAARVRELCIPGLSAEVTYDRSAELPYASPGAIRTDVILRDYKDGMPSVTAIWDLKTGNAVVSAARAREIREKVGVGLDTPLIEIQTRTGIRIKEMSDVLAVRSHARKLGLPRAAGTDHPGASGCA